MEELSQREMDRLMNIGDDLYYYKIEKGEEYASNLLSALSKLRQDIKLELRILSNVPDDNNNFEEIILVSPVPISEIIKEYGISPLLKEIKRSEVKTEYELDFINFEPNFPVNIDNYIDALNEMNKDKLAGGKIDFEIDETTEIAKLISSIPYSELKTPNGYYGNVGIDKDGYIGMLKYNYIKVTVGPDGESIEKQNVFDVPYYRRMIEMIESEKRLERIKALMGTSEEIINNENDVESNRAENNQNGPSLLRRIVGFEREMSAERRERRHTIRGRIRDIRRATQLRTIAALTSAGLFIGATALLLSQNDVTLSQLIVDNSLNTELIANMLKNINTSTALLYGGSFIYDLMAVLLRIGSNIQSNSLENYIEMQRIEQNINNNTNDEQIGRHK